MESMSREAKPYGVGTVISVLSLLKGAKQRTREFGEEALWKVGVA